MLPLSRDSLSINRVAGEYYRGCLSLLVPPPPPKGGIEFQGPKNNRGSEQEAGTRVLFPILIMQKLQKVVRGLN